jgi:hypothetical protein
VGVGVTVEVGNIVAVLLGTGVLVAVGISTKVGVGVAVGETVGVALRASVPVDVDVGTSATAGGMFVDVGVPVGSEVHQGAVKEKPSNTQVRSTPPLQVV